MGEFKDKATGKVKEVYGVASGNRRVEAEGKAQHGRGQLKGILERIKITLKDALRKPRQPQRNY